MNRGPYYRKMMSEGGWRAPKRALWQVTEQATNRLWWCVARTEEEAVVEAVADLYSIGFVIDTSVRGQGQLGCRWSVRRARPAGWLTVTMSEDAARDSWPREPLPAGDRYAVRARVYEWLEWFEQSPGIIAIADG